MLVATIRQSDPAIVKLGMARDGILHVNLLSDLCQLSTVGFSFESLVRSESISLHVEHHDEPTRMSAEPDEDVVLDTKRLVC